MRLYHRNGATSVAHDGVQYEPADDGGFDFPEPIGQHLATFPHWETRTQREQRRVREDTARRRDPASQYDELAAMREEMRAAQSKDAELAELRKRVAELEAGKGDQGNDQGGEGGDPSAADPSAIGEPAEKPAASKP